MRIDLTDTGRLEFVQWWIDRLASCYLGVWIQQYDGVDPDYHHAYWEPLYIARQPMPDVSDIYYAEGPSFRTLSPVTFTSDRPAIVKGVFISDYNRGDVRPEPLLVTENISPGVAIDVDNPFRVNFEFDVYSLIQMNYAELP